MITIEASQTVYYEQTVEVSESQYKKLREQFDREEYGALAAEIDTRDIADAGDIEIDDVYFY